MLTRLIHRVVLEVLAKFLMGVSMRFLFVILLFSSCSAWALPSSTIPIQFYYVSTPEVIPFLEAKRAVKHVQGYYRHYFNLALKVKKFRKQRDLFQPEINYIDTALARFIAWYDFTEGKRHYGEITQVITGPLLSDGEWFTAGLGYVGCARNTNLLNFSIAYTTLISMDKHDRFVHAKAAIAHEIGHNLNAKHVKDCSLMDTNLLYCLGNKGKRVPKPSKSSKSEIEKCIKTTTGRQDSSG